MFFQNETYFVGINWIIMCTGKERISSACASPPLDVTPHIP